MKLLPNRFYLFQLVSFSNVLTHRMIQLLFSYWIITDQNQSAIHLSSILSVSVFFEVASTLFFGWLADAYNKAKVLMFSYTGSIVAAILLLLAIHMGVYSLPVFMISFSVMGCMLGIRVPIEGSIIPDLVCKEEISEAISQKTTLYSVATIAGPAIGALFVEYFGIVPSLYGYCGTLLCSIVLLLRIYQPVVKGTTEIIKPTFSKYFSGFKSLFHIRSEFFVSIMSSMVNFMLMPFFLVLIPFYVFDLMGDSATNIAILEGAFSVGIIMSSVVGQKILFNSLGRLTSVFAGYILMAIGPTALGLSDSILLQTISMFISGFGFIVVNINHSIPRTIATPDSHRNRIMSSIIFLSRSINPIGTFFAGISITLFGVQEAMLLSGIVFFLCGFAIFLIPNYAYILSLSDEELDCKYLTLYPKAFQ